MALKKIAAKSPFNNISRWVWDKKKKVIPNPMDIQNNPLKPGYRKPKTKEIVELHLTGDSLQKLLNETHRPAGLINKIIDEVNTLIKKVRTNQTDISKINNKLKLIDNQLKLKSSKMHSHASAMGPTGPPIGKKGGSVRKMQGGGRTRPVTTSREQMRQKLITEIKRMQ